jgi:hypothetical protein
MEVNILKTPQERSNAMAKAMEMSKLFHEPYFSEIEDILEKNQTDKAGAEAQFKEFATRHNAEKPEFLTQKQQAWLWNYLKNYDKKIDWMPGADW